MRAHPADIAPNTALHFTLVSATPNPPTARDTAARRSRARFPPTCALVARRPHPRLGPRLGPRYLHHARPMVAACALDLSTRAPVACHSCAPSPPHVRSLLTAPAPHLGPRHAVTDALVPNTQTPLAEATGRTTPRGDQLRRTRHHGHMHQRGGPPRFASDLILSVNGLLDTEPHRNLETDDTPEQHAQEDDGGMVWIA
ncbi:hypothetical protein B0H14DRAFT_3494872 [Mycena olivaceomarginata]|nr:hypothetical protein B0H14DRAFT_3494872 [Mycena olivaceomarginata]